MRLVIVVFCLFAMTTSQASAQAGKEDICRAQKALKAAGYAPGALNCTMNSWTIAAIRAYQKDHGLPVDGALTPGLLTRLSKSTEPGKGPAPAEAEEDSSEKPGDTANEAVSEQTSQPRWQKVEDKLCLVWNPVPNKNETVTWSGPCVNGKAEGSGQMVWTYDEDSQQKVETYTGEMRNGRPHGLGEFNGPDDDHFKGQFADGRPVRRVVKPSREETPGTSTAPAADTVETTSKQTPLSKPVERPEGPNWSKAKNQDCYVWNPQPQPNETVTWSGPCVGGKAEGKGEKVWYYKSAGKDKIARYIGWMRAGKNHGQGIYRAGDGSVYQGMHVDGKRTGKGRLAYANGNRYVGDFVDYVRTGRGVFRFADGNRYEGEFRRGQMTGQGIMNYADGNRYEGDFIDGERNGEGVINYANGDRYEGDFDDGKHSGKGVLNFANGDRYEGEFLDGDRSGSGVVEFANGERYQGEFVRDKPYGWGHYVWPGGDQYIGEFEDGVISGQGSYFWRNGDQYKGLWRHGGPEGQSENNVRSRPHGVGVLVLGGEEFAGIWRDGCFKQGGRTAAIFRDLESCP